MYIGNNPNFVQVKSIAGTRFHVQTVVATPNLNLIKLDRILSVRYENVTVFKNGILLTKELHYIYRNRANNVMGDDDVFVYFIQLLTPLAANDVLTVIIGSFFGESIDIEKSLLELVYSSSSIYNDYVINSDTNVLGPLSFELSNTPESLNFVFMFVDGKLETSWYPSTSTGIQIVEGTTEYVALKKTLIVGQKVRIYKNFVMFKDFEHNPIKQYIDTQLKEFRMQFVGRAVQLEGDVLPHNHLWADRTFISFDAWPEIREKYEAGMLMTLPHDATQAAIDKFPRKWVKVADNSGLLLPNIGGRFEEAWRPNQVDEYDRLAGSVKDDCLIEVEGKLPYTSNTDDLYDATNAFRFVETGAPPSVDNGQKITHTGQYVSFKHSHVTRTGDRTRAHGDAVPTAIFMGRSKLELGLI